MAFQPWIQSHRKSESSGDIATATKLRSGAADLSLGPKRRKNAPASTNSLSARQQLIMADVGTAHFLRKPTRERQPSFTHKQNSELQWPFMPASAKEHSNSEVKAWACGHGTDRSTPSHCVRNQHETKSSLDLHQTPTPTTHNRN